MARALPYDGHNRKAGAAARKKQMRNQAVRRWIRAAMRFLLTHSREAA